MGSTRLGCAVADKTWSGSPSAHSSGRSVCASCASLADLVAGRCCSLVAGAVPGVAEAAARSRCFRRRRHESGSCSCGKCRVHSISAGRIRSQPSCCLAVEAGSLRERRQNRSGRNRKAPPGSRYLLVTAVAVSVGAWASSTQRLLHRRPVRRSSRPAGLGYVAALGPFRRQLARCPAARGCSSWVSPSRWKSLLRRPSTSTLASAGSSRQLAACTCPTVGQTGSSTPSCPPVAELAIAGSRPCPPCLHDASVRSATEIASGTGCFANAPRFVGISPDSSAAGSCQDGFASYVGCLG